jgi:holliday junction DNA helicase RuvA
MRCSSQEPYRERLGHANMHSGRPLTGDGAMISLLRGEVAVRRSDHVVVLCSGVGYRAAVSTETLRHVPAVGGEIALHTHLVVRDDALALHGFHSEQERDLFLMLLSVQAVGPKVALAILSSGPARELLAAIAAADAKRFQSVAGVGKRTAERIIVELREKVGVPADPDGASIVAHAVRADSPRGLAHEGLVALGYSALEADELLREAAGETAQELIGAALRSARTSS